MKLSSLTALPSHLSIALGDRVPVLKPPLRRIRGWLDHQRLDRLPRVTCDVTNLRRTTSTWLRSVLADRAAAAAWSPVEIQLAEFEITTSASAGGVNAGDRRAIYCLVRALRPKRVLEIGTHIGASSVHIGAALRDNDDAAGELTTVDVRPVNDPVTRPWEAAGSRFAPADMMERIGMGARVRFVTQPSLTFLATGDQRYDLIFLDGDHSPQTVYRELSAALRRLAPDGVVLLHDYFPGGRPLWPDNVVAPGPWLATERLRAEGARLRIEPLGALPWPTKQGTNVSSLAVASRTD